MNAKFFLANDSLLFYFFFLLSLFMCSFTTLVLDRGLLDGNRRLFLRTHPSTESVRLLGWPSPVDGRGWPKQCAFDERSWASVILLVRARTVTAEQPTEFEVVTAKDEAFCRSALVRVTLTTDWESTSELLGVQSIVSSADGFVQSFSQLRSARGKLQYQGVRRQHVDYVHEQPVIERFASESWRIASVNGGGAYTGARAWYRWSSNGRLVVFPAHWYGPNVLRECLLVVDVEQDLVVATVSLSGECHFPDCSLSVWHRTVQKTLVPDAAARRAGMEEFSFDCIHIAQFSPDSMLLAIMPHGDCHEVILVDCEKSCELPCSRKVIRSCADESKIGKSQHKSAPGGSLAFDPSSVVGGRTCRMALTFAENLCRSPNFRSSLAHSLCVYDMRRNRVIWRYDHDYCINEVCYNRYGTVLAATLCRLIGFHAPWDILLFDPFTGNVLHEVSLPGADPVSHMLSLSPLATHVLTFSYAHAHTKTFFEPDLLYIAHLPVFPNLLEQCRFAIHKHVHTQTEVDTLDLPASLKAYLCHSLPFAWVRRLKLV